MSDFPDNDWRDYLAHASKYDWSSGKNPSDYNHDYYMSRRDEIIARMKARYAKFGKRRKQGDASAAAGEAEEEGTSSKKKGSGKKGGSSKKGSSSKAKAANTAAATSTQVGDDAPEWLKNYAAEIDKVRASTGNSSWVPAHVNDFNAWAKELKETYPDLNLSGSAAKEVWGTINEQFGSGGSTTKSKSNKSSSKKSSSSKSSSKSSNEESSTSSKAPKAREKRVTEGSADVHKRATEESSPKMSEKNKKVYDELVENYRKGASGEIDAYKDDGETVSAYDDYEEWQAEMGELGADDSDLTKENWEEFKKTRKVGR